VITINGISFNDINAVRDNAVTAEVPIGAVTGSVLVDGVDAGVLTVFRASFSPTTASVGDTITFTGVETEWLLDEPYITINDIEFDNIVYLSDTSMTAEVPVGATTGNVFTDDYDINAGLLTIV
jgi:hypothetical protein